MAGRNGTGAATFAPIRLPDLSPEKVTIVIERDGEPVNLAGYVSGNRCPVMVTIAQSAAYQRWADAQGDPSLSVGDKTAAYLLYVRDSLKAVVPGLSDDEADVIAGDAELRADILVALKWWTRTGIEDADPEAMGEGASPSTTDGSSPASAPSTASA